MLTWGCRKWFKVAWWDGIGHILHSLDGDNNQIEDAG